MVLLTKWKREYWEISIVEVMRKVCAAVVNCRLKKSVALHNSLHGLREDQGTGTATLEANTVQQLDRITHELLLQIFLDARKAYDLLDRGRCLEILRVYGLGPNLDRLLTNNCKLNNIEPKLGKFLGKAFETGRGVKQGNPASPMIFNISVDAVVRAVIDVVCVPQEAQHRFVWVAGKRNLVFYTEDGSIADYKWVQDALIMTVAMFLRMGLDANLDKTKSIVFTPGFIYGKWDDQAYKQRAMGEGQTFR